MSRRRKCLPPPPQKKIIKNSPSLVHELCVVLKIIVIKVNGAKLLYRNQSRAFSIKCRPFYLILDNPFRLCSRGIFCMRILMLKTRVLYTKIHVPFFCMGISINGAHGAFFVVLTCYTCVVLTRNATHKKASSRQMFASAHWEI